MGTLSTSLECVHPASHPGYPNDCLGLAMAGDNISCKPCKPRQDHLGPDLLEKAIMLVILPVI